MVQQHQVKLGNYKQSDKKLQRYKKKLIDEEIELFKATNHYLEESQKKIGVRDFNKIVEAELSYKTAFRNVQDKKAKILDQENQVKLDKEEYDNMNETIENEIKNLKNDSDNVFRVIVDKMAEFYNEVQRESHEIKNQNIGAQNLQGLERGMSNIPGLFGMNSMGLGGFGKSPQKNYSNKAKESWKTSEMEKAFENIKIELYQIPLEIENKIQHLEFMKHFLDTVSKHFV